MSEATQQSVDAMAQSSSSDVAALPLPHGFRSIENILNMTNEQLRTNTMVNVIGLVKDHQPPMKTKGTDWKCTFRIFDFSTQREDQQTRTDIQVSVFNKQEKLPSISGPGDVFLIRNIKVQMYSGYVSLLANFATEMNVFMERKIPSWPVTVADPLRTAFMSRERPLSAAESSYVVWLNSFVEKDAVPSKMEFESNLGKAQIQRDKFAEFRDLKPDGYYDLVGEVLSKFESDGRSTVYLSDYTEHPLFYHHVIGGPNADADVRDGDEYGYVKTTNKKLSQWTGPLGKRSIQLTAFDEHAIFIRDEVKVGAWVLLRNVQVRMGKEGGCLEGFLRGDRGRVNVQILKFEKDSDTNDERGIQALRRKRDYEKKQKAQYAELAKVVQAENFGKRKAEDMGITRKNSKQRKKEIAAAVNDQIAVYDQKQAEAANLNANVKCQNMMMRPTFIRDILNSKTSCIRLNSGSSITSPFTNRKYRSDIRIVDFWPHTLADFALGLSIGEYDVLADESEDGSEDEQSFHSYAPKKWEWRFALLVEDAHINVSDNKDRIWVTVDNAAGEGLLKMTAVGLRTEETVLLELREKLFHLWGDLEEKKSAFLSTKLGKTIRWHSSIPEREDESEAEKPDVEDSESEDGAASKKKAGKNAPPPHSEEEDTVPAANTKRKVNKGRAAAATSKNGTIKVSTENDELKAIRKMSMAEAQQLYATKIDGLGVANKGFTACIQEWGVKFPEEDADKADAGDGMRWKRMFGLFGTHLS